MLYSRRLQNNTFGTAVEHHFYFCFYLVEHRSKFYRHFKCSVYGCGRIMNTNTNDKFYTGFYESNDQTSPLENISFLFHFLCFTRL